MREPVYIGITFAYLLREVRRVVPKVRFTPPRACLLAFLLASSCFDVARSAGARLVREIHVIVRCDVLSAFCCERRPTYKRWWIRC